MQRAARVELAICLVAGAAAAGRHDRVVSLVRAGALLGGLVVVLSAYRGYDWRGRPMSSRFGRAVDPVDPARRVRPRPGVRLPGGRLVIAVRIPTSRRGLRLSEYRAGT